LCLRKRTGSVRISEILPSPLTYISSGETDPAEAIVTISGVAHAGICVPDVEAAVAWYRGVLGMRVLSPPYLVAGAAIEEDMGELIPVVALKAAIVGFDQTDHVLELIEYPGFASAPAGRALTDNGISHVGLTCEDLDATRAELEAKGVRFLTRGTATIAGLRTAWFEDPYGVVFILMQKGDPDRPYWRQPSPAGG
jgi:catechol 2,3-dioxygenase-like lactoylglutathione lyase family enzyme